MSVESKEEVFLYLDELRESGKTNMYGACPYIQEVFQISKSEATKLLAEWMNTFAERHRKQDYRKC